MNNIEIKRNIYNIYDVVKDLYNILDNIKVEKE